MITRCTTSPTGRKTAGYRSAPGWGRHGREDHERGSVPERAARLRVNLLLHGELASKAIERDVRPGSRQRTLKGVPPLGAASGAEGKLALLICRS